MSARAQYFPTVAHNAQYQSEAKPPSQPPPPPNHLESELAFFAAAAVLAVGVPSDHLLYGFFALAVAVRAFPWRRGIHAASTQSLVAWSVLHGTWLFLCLSAVALVLRHAF